MKTSFNMKNKKILIGAATTAVIASALLFAPSLGETSYQPRENTSANKAEGISGAFDFYNKIRSNSETGLIDKEEWLRLDQEFAQMSVNREDIGWKDHGPDNVGGRTRAILIDKANNNHLWAGSVGGGLFVSINRGNTWAKVNGFTENLSISSMCMTDNGNIYISTGHSAENDYGTTDGGSVGVSGAGVYESTDGGVTFTVISGTENYSWTNEVVAAGNDVFMASTSGLEKLSGGVLSSTDLGGAVAALSISADGTVLVAGTGATTKVSTDGGATFSTVSGSGDGEIPGSTNRREYAISHEKVDGKYIIYACLTNGANRLKGVYKSLDHGVVWEEIAPENDGTVGSFAPFGSNTQGWYDNIITVVPGQPHSILLGGVDVYAKSNTGNWEQRSNGFFGQMSPLYVHSDQHEMQWDSEGRLWVGNDGGVFFSDDNGNSFHEADRNYNVTQFFKIGFSAHGDVIGGAQDNGTQANYHDNATYREHDAVGGGDGFGCAMSFMNRDILLTTVYYGSVSRSGDRGNNSNAYGAANIPVSSGAPGVSLGDFNTCIELYENPNDLGSTDILTIIPSQAYALGDVIEIPSLTSGMTIDYTATTAITFEDTLAADNSLTVYDTLVYTLPSLDEANVNTLTYTFVFGGPIISIGDTLLIDGTEFPVDSIGVLADHVHYYGSNTAEPGEVVDMGSEDTLNNVAWDTLKVQDHYQSWFALGLGSYGVESNGIQGIQASEVQNGGVWLTRNGLRLSASHDGFLLAAGGDTDPLVGVVTTMEFSANGNHLFIGTDAGRVYRLSGLDDIYSPNPITSTNQGNIPDTLLAFDKGHYSTTFEEVGSFGNNYITNLSSDPQDPDHLVVTIGNTGGSGKVQESENATLFGGATFTSIVGDLPNAPMYSVVIDRNDPNLILVGCDYGVFMTSNGGTAWENVSSPEFGNVPVFDMGQNWRTWDEGCKKPGEIYIGTHGRGIWSTDAYLGLEEAQDNLDQDVITSDILVYPNPMSNFGTIAFELNENSDVTIQVFALNGKLVQTIQESNMTKGANSININADELSTGTYFVRVSAGDMIKTTKFIKH
jgi:hypothetical protein